MAAGGRGSKMTHSEAYSFWAELEKDRPDLGRGCGCDPCRAGDPVAARSSHPDQTTVVISSALHSSSARLMLGL